MERRDRMDVYETVITDFPELKNKLNKSCNPWGMLQNEACNIPYFNNRKYSLQIGEKHRLFENQKTPGGMEGPQPLHL